MVGAESAERDQRSKFMIRLSNVFTPERQVVDMNSMEISPQAAPNWRVLIVDDNVDSTNLVATIMQMYGHQTQKAYNGESALEMITVYRPDFVLLDIGLPDINGYEVAQRIRENPQTKNVKLIAVTGYGFDSDRQKSKESGFDYHLVKPIDPGELPKIFDMLARQSSP